MVRLRPYQTAAISDARNLVGSGQRRLLLTAPTGSGKTVIGTEIIKHAVNRGSRVLWLAHRRELVFQCSSKIELEHGIIMAGEPATDSPVQVASVQTLARREIPAWDLLIIDEAHHATSAMYRKAIDANPEGVVLGLTATPTRFDGKGLGDLFDHLHEVAKLSELVGDGFLVAPRVFAPYVPDLAQARIVRGDFDRKTVDEIMGAPRVVGNIVETWFEKAKGTRTLLFAPSVAQSKLLVEQFRKRGVASAHIDGETPKGTRDGVLRDFAAGRVVMLGNFGVVTEGYDCPAAQTCILARPTNSVSLFLQMVGRITRPYEGKKAMVLDHAGNTLRHGMPTEDREWVLHTSRLRKKDKETVALKNCPECFAISPSARRLCTLCGYEFWPQPREIRTTDGTLVEIDGRLAGRVSARKLAWIVERGSWYTAKVTEGIRRGHKSGWARIQYKLQWGFWPSKDVMSVRVPDPAGDPT